MYFFSTSQPVLSSPLKLMGVLCCLAFFISPDPSLSPLLWPLWWYCTHSISHCCYSSWEGNSLACLLLMFWPVVLSCLPYTLDHNYQSCLAQLAVPPLVPSFLPFPFPRSKWTDFFPCSSQSWIPPCKLFPCPNQFHTVLSSLWVHHTGLSFHVLILSIPPLLWPLWWCHITLCCPMATAFKKASSSHLCSSYIMTSCLLTSPLQPGP